MNRLDSLAEKFRRVVLSRDDDTAAALAAIYLLLHRRLSYEIDQLARRMETAQTTSAAGSMVRSRPDVFLHAVHAETDAFAAHAETVIQSGERVAVLDAAAHSADLIEAAAGVSRDAIRHANPASTMSMVGRLSDGSPLADLLNQFAPEAAARAKETLLSGMKNGKNPRAIAAELKQDLNIPLTRALTIARTEMMAAYRSAALEGYRANSDILTGWMWSAELDPSTCASCLAMDGRIFPLDVPFGSHPNCRCSVIPITKLWWELGLTDIPETSAAERRRISGEQWFEQQPDSVQMQVLGPSKLREYQAGRIGLVDLVGYRVDRTWGPQRWERSLTQVRAGRYEAPKSALGKAQEPLKKR